MRGRLGGMMRGLLAATLTTAWLGIGALLPGAVAEADGPKLSGTPAEIFKAFVDALRAGDRAAMLKMLGPEGKQIVSSGDDVADRETWRRFVEKYDQAHRLEAGGGHIDLIVGTDNFPLPVPLVPAGDGWRFDTDEGLEEILRRRVGRNELDTIQVCLAIVDAQREYYGLGTGKDGMLVYAQHLVSSPGKRDGLYWPTKPGERPSPLGALAARAHAAGYRAGAGGRTPFRGYFYRLLTAQGPAAPGGAYNYVVRGQMMGGFAAVAYPAQYRENGVMTFIVSHDGVVYQKDLGEGTAQAANAMKTFNPDSTWQRVNPAAR